MRDPLAAQLGFGVSVRGADSACNVGTPGRCGREGEAARFTEPLRPLYIEYWCRAARSANSSPSVRAWPCRRIGTDFARRCDGLSRAPRHRRLTSLEVVYEGSSDLICGSGLLAREP